MAKRRFHSLAAAEAAVERAELRAEELAAEVERRRAEVARLRAESREGMVGPFPNPGRTPPYPGAMARRFLGMDRVLSYGPRPKCDYRDVCDRWWAGETMESIAASYDCTRQNVEQVIRGAAPTWERKLRRHVQSVRTRMRALADRTYVCQVCAVYFVKGSCGPTGDSCGRNAFCSDEHYRIWMQLRLHVDEERHAKHRVLGARRRHELDPTPEHLAHLRRCETGTQKSQGRWFTRGSKNLAAALLAYENGWPIFDQLPEQCQAQVIDLARAA